jgi:regulator of replication initiation timing
METKLILFTLGKITDEIENLKSRISELSEELVTVKESKQHIPVEAPLQVDPTKDTLIDTKEVMNMLGICYNSLCKLVKEGFIKRIRINQRRMKYSKTSIINFIQTNS